MTPRPPGHLFGHRRADRFAQLLDESAGGRRRHSRTPYDEELTDLVAVARSSADQLSTVAEQVTVDPSYRDRLRQRLLAVAHTQGLGATAHHTPEPEPVADAGPRRRAKIAIAVGAAMGVLALSGVSTASGDAIPGDTLYPVKRHTERAQLALAGSDLNRGQLHLGFARSRLDEAMAVSQLPAALNAALDDMDADTREGVRLLHTAAVERRDPEVISTVDSFTADQRREVVDLITRLQGESRTRTLASLELLDRAADRASELRQSLLCTAESIGRIDSLGPLPQHCAALPRTERPVAAPESDDESSRKGRTSAKGTAPDRPGAGPSAEPTPSDLPPVAPSQASENPDEPSRSPSAGILDELGRIIGDLLG